MLKAEMEGEIKNLSYVCSLILASLSYCYFIASKIPPGKLRLISLLPIFYLFSILPYSLSSAFNTAVVTFFITWLSNFKLLLFCFNQGPLSSHPPKSFLFFISIAFLPIRIKQNIENNPSPKPPKKLPLNLATELLAFAILVRVLYNYKQRLHQDIILVLYCCLCFLVIDILIALSSAMVRALVGLELELEPPSDEPYLSTSLQDFWGKRWNLTVNSTLRDTVYKPVRRGSAKLFGEEWAPLPAVFAAFLVSGLMHELLFYNVTRVNPTWEMTLFFALHGVCVVAEVGVKIIGVGQGQGQRWDLPWIVWTGLTVGFVVVTSFWLFFPPLIRNGVDARVLQEIWLFVEFVRDKLHFILWARF